MLQFSSSSVCKPLELIFKKYMENVSFFSEWKKGNVILIHKKYYKQCLKNCRPVFLLPICGYVFEK